jgi:Phage integrase family
LGLGLWSPEDLRAVRRKPEILTKSLPNGPGLTLALRGRAAWLLANHSLKNNCDDYFSRVQYIENFFVDRCSRQAISLWPLSVMDMLDFIAAQSERGNQLETLEGYVNAVEWLHDLCGFPSIKEDGQYPTLQRLVEASGRANFTPVQGKEGFTSQQVTSIIDECLSLYNGGGSVSWFRAAVIFAGMDDTAGRVNEILEASTSRTVFLEGGDIRINLPYQNSKSTSLRKQRRDAKKSDFIIIRGRGAHWFRCWWSYCKLDLPGKEDCPVFEGAIPGIPLSYSAIRAQLKTVVQRIGLDPTKYGTHSFRKGRSMMAFQQGVPVEDIRVMLRHAPKSGATASYLPKGALTKFDSRFNTY